MTRYTVSRLAWWRIPRWLVWREQAAATSGDYAVWRCTPAARCWTEAGARNLARKLTA